DSIDHDRPGNLRFGKAKPDESGPKIRIYAIEAGTPYDHRHQTTRQGRHCERIELQDLRPCIATPTGPDPVVQRCHGQTEDPESDENGAPAKSCANKRRRRGTESQGY